MPILAIGGIRDDRLFDHIVELAGARTPKLLWVGTASAERPQAALEIYRTFHGKADVAHLEFFPWPPRDLRDVTFAQDVILVGGGNTANMLAIWRTHGFDEILREAWERDVVLAGWSAGAICWFESGVTDSFGPQLDGLECLGFLPGSACPHYDGEELRRPRYAELVREGFPAGIAIDDDVAVRYDGTALTEVVTVRDGATAYRVEPGSEERLDARLLT